MKKPIIIAIVIIAAIFFISKGGCEFNVSTAKISDAKVCTSLTGNICSQDSPKISPSTDEIYVSCKMKYAVADTKVKFTWLYYGNTKIEIDNVILDTDNNMGTLELHSSLSRPTNGWPKGVYEVVIQIQTDNAKPMVKQFSIE